MKVKELRQLLQGLDDEKEVLLSEMHQRQFDSDIEVFVKAKTIGFRENGIVLKK